jgi:hypothetical protein
MRSVDDLDTMFDSLNDLTLQQRATIKERYRFLMSEYRWRCRLYMVLFYVFRVTMTVGSLAVPAMLSLNNLEDKIITKGLYWGTWGLSLAVTTANGLLTLFKLDKRFFMLHAVAEKLRSETWQYLMLSGRYSGRYGGVRPSHRNQFVYYTYKIEKIRMQHINEEYVRPAGDDNKKAVVAPTSTNTDTAVGGGRRDSISQDVPTPPDQALLRAGTTPSPQSGTGVAATSKILAKQDSGSTIGKGDEVALEIYDKKDEKGAEGTALPVHDTEGAPVSPSSNERDTILFTTPEV